MSTEILKNLKIEFRYSQKQKMSHSDVSTFVGTQKTERTDTPVYYHFKLAKFNGKDYLALYLVFFYVHNPGYFPIPCLPRFNLGAHPADVERIVILYDPSTKHPEYVYFGAHGTGQGVWVPYSRCEMTPDGALCVYVSPSSHALYPHPRPYLRVFGFANDVTSNRGKAWRPTLEHYEDAHNQSWSESHYQVKRGINSPKNVPDPTITSISSWERFALALPYVQNKLKNAPRLPVVPLVTHNTTTAA